MLLKNLESPPINYLDYWPEHYYEIDDPAIRKTVLMQAIDQKLDPACDSFRLTLLEKRYKITDKKNRTIDTFMRAWTMIKAADATGVNFFQKRYQKRELEKLMVDLCLLDSPVTSEAEQSVLEAEWAAFARFYIITCTGSKAYCSTLFGIVPIRDTSVASKIADEIDLVTRRYPASLNLADSFIPLRKVFSEIYCKMIENGIDYWRSFENK